VKTAVLSGEPLRALLLAEGADLVGFGDVSALSPGQWTSCVSLAVRLPASTICGISDGPSMDYFEQYHTLNAKLDQLSELAASYIVKQGFHALAQTTTAVAESAGYHTPFPHKTCATRAGLGWVGKSALLVTPEFGPAVRLSSVLTDAAFDHPGQPVNASRCGDCARCRDHCPGGAIHGALWDIATEREVLVDVDACRKAARALAKERTGQEITLCGKCIQICPYTQRYTKKEAAT
jgi:epoxyqueuosine reductase